MNIKLGIHYLFIILTVFCAYTYQKKYVADTSDLEAAVDNFAMTLTQKLYEEDKKKNRIVSPLAIQSMLAFYTMGCEKGARADLEKALGVSDKVETVEIGSALNNVICTSPQLIISASRLYLRKTGKIDPDFNYIANLVNSEIKFRDFTLLEEAVYCINKWVKDETKEKFDSLVGSHNLPANSEAVIVMALYIKGQWLCQFKTSGTSDMEFHTTKDETVSIDMMSNVNYYRYVKMDSLKATAVSLPLRKLDFRVIFVIPNEINGLADVLSSLQNKGIRSILEKLPQRADQLVKIFIPSGKYETSLTSNTKDILKKMGLAKAFEEKTSKILINNTISLTEVFQKSFIHIDERGINVEDTDTAGWADGTIRSHNYTEIKADRPFMYAILKGDFVVFTGLFVNRTFILDDSFCNV